MRIALVSALTLVGCASSGSAVGRSHLIPEALRVPLGQTLAVVARARGVQIYECRKAKDADRFEWTFRAPEAELFNDAGDPIGMHYAGPTWEASDGSKIVGEVKAKDAGPDPHAIPWLLLAVKSANGEGLLGGIASIQRVETVGGQAPADGCSRERSGAVARVDYRAKYRFYRHE
jgi:hypothetical protein